MKKAFVLVAALVLLTAPAMGDDAHDHFVCGQMAWTLGFSDEAITEFTKALEINPKYAEACLYRGIARAAKGELNDALADFDKAIEIQPDLPQAYSGRAYARQTKGDLEGALADYTKTIELKPDWAEAHGGRGSIKQAMGDLDGALADFDKAIALKADLAEARIGRGGVKRAKGDLDGALADYTKAIELNPKYAGAYQSRGFLYYDLRAFTNALADFHKACELDPENQSSSHLGVWLVRARLGEQKAASEELQAYLANRKTGTPDDWPSKVACFLAGRLSELDFLKAAGDIGEKENAGHYCAALFYAGSKRLLAGDIATARDYFEKCLGTQAKTYFEYDGAAAELKFLQAAK
ncbi:MAG: tetratricopeptide repeat protein [Limisphaerales bacterium]